MVFNLKKGFLFCLVFLLAAVSVNAELNRGVFWTDIGDGSGNQTRAIYSGAVNYHNGSGYSPVETTIVASTDPLYQYNVTKGYYKAFFKTNPTVAQTVKYQKNSGEVTYQPFSLNFRNDLDQIQQISITQAVTGVASDNQFTYPNVFGTGLNLSYAYLPEVLKEKLVIKDFATLPTPAQYIYDGKNPTVDLDFLVDYPTGTDIYIDSVLWDKKTTKTTYNRVDFKNSSGDVIFYLPKPYAYDANGKETMLMYVFKKSGTKLYVVLKTNYSWLNSTSRTYPVVIDPSTEIVSQVKAIHSADGNVSSLISKDDSEASIVNGGSPGEKITINNWNSSIPSNARDLNVLAYIDLQRADTNFELRTDFTTIGGLSGNDVCTINAAGLYKCNLTASGVDSAQEVDKLELILEGWDTNGGAVDSGSVDFVYLNVSYATQRELSSASISTDIITAEKGETVEMTCSYGLVGIGKVPDITMYWEYCAGEACTPTKEIPHNFSAELYDTTKAKPGTPREQTTHFIEGGKTGNYKVRCRAYDASNSIEKTTTSTTITITEITASNVEWCTTINCTALSFVPDYSKYSSSDLIDELTTTTGEFSDSKPIITPDGIFVQTNNHIYRYNLNGEPLWNYGFTGNVYSTPAVVDGKVYYFGLHEVYSRNLDGSLNWQFSSADDFFDINSPLVYNGKLWASSWKYNLIVLNITNGNVIARPPLSNNYLNDPTISEDTVYITSDRTLFALNESNSSQTLWNYSIEGISEEFYSNSPVVKGNKVFATAEVQGDKPSFVLCLNKYTGELIWRSTIPDLYHTFERSYPVVYAGKVFVTATDWSSSSYAYVFDENNGNLLYKSENMNSYIWASPTATDGKVIMGSRSKIYAFNSNDLSTTWTYENVGSGIYSTPAIVNGEVYFGGEDGNVHRLRAKTVYSNDSISLETGKKTSIDAKEADAIIEIYGKNNFAGALSIKKHLNNPKGTGIFGQTTLNKYVEIRDPDNLKQNMDFAMIKIYYTDDEIAAAGVIDETSLKLYYWNETSQALEQEPNSGVNATENYVWANVTHFSVFGSGGKPKDSDGDGIADKEDNCINTQNPKQEDKNKDGIGDYCDSDKDGVLDYKNEQMSDNCRFTQNADQKDSDNDGVGDSCDNCPLIANKKQKDSDHDYYMGDVCDPDNDNDGMLNEEDNCPFLYSEYQLEDSDGDFVGDSCDMCQAENSTGLDADKNGCKDNIYGLQQLSKENGLSKNLMTKIEGAIKALNSGKISQAIKTLELFINAVSQDKTIEQTIAELLINYTRNVIAQLR